MSHAQYLIPELDQQGLREFALVTGRIHRLGPLPVERVGSLKCSHGQKIPSLL